MATKYVILTGSKLSTMIDDPDFRRRFPELKDYFKQYDRLSSFRKSQRRCSKCGSGRRIFPKMLDRIRTSHSLSDKIRRFFETEELKALNVKDGKVVVETLA